MLRLYIYINLKGPVPFKKESEVYLALLFEGCFPSYCVWKWCEMSQVPPRERKGLPPSEQT